MQFSNSISVSGHTFVLCSTNYYLHTRCEIKMHSRYVKHYKGCLLLMEFVRLWYLIVVHVLQSYVNCLKWRNVHSSFCLTLLRSLLTTALNVIQSLYCLYSKQKTIGKRLYVVVLFSINSSLNNKLDFSPLKTLYRKCQTFFA